MAHREINDRNIRNTETRDREEDKRLYFLHDLDKYKVASEHPDVRGWKLVDSSHNEVGTIDNLLVDVKDEKVRYLDVELDENILGEDYDPQANPNVKGVHGFTNREGDKHLIVPIGLARLDKDDHCVVVDEVRRETFQRAPRHRKGTPISADYEFAVSEALASPQAGMRQPADRPVGTAVPGEFYKRREFDETRFYNR
ncbi:PRC-barrel domain-containing protein [Fulvivirga kasyanovii]|nr:PRC-barrel domain-containing protein [Fulvivirga kasyanovii]